MALEDFGEDTAKVIDLSVKALHDLILSVVASGIYNPAQIQFMAKEDGIWSVVASMLDGKPAVEIRLAVG